MTTQVSRYQKGKTNLDLLKQETMSGSGISWAICRSAPHLRQITMQAPHPVFYRPDALPASQQTVSKHWRQNETETPWSIHTLLKSIKKYLQQKYKNTPVSSPLAAMFLLVFDSLRICSSSETRCCSNATSSLLGSFSADAGAGFEVFLNLPNCRNTHTHTTVSLLFWNMSGTTQVSRYQKGKTRNVNTNLNLLEQEIVGGSGICWAICKSAPHSRQPRQHPTTQFFTGRMPFLSPNQQRQSTEGT